MTDFNEIDDGEVHIILCHYPILYRRRGYMIHGHLHQTRGPEYGMLRQMPRVLNAGVDVNFYRPVTLPQLIENNRAFYSGENDAPPPCRQRCFPRRPSGGSVTAGCRAGRISAPFRPGLILIRSDL